MASVLRSVFTASLLLASCRAGPPPSRVVVAYPQGPESLLPYTNNDEYTSSVLSNVFEPLVAFDGDLATRPALAESWTTPDDHTWVFRLRPGLRLHDGRPLDASDVAASLDQVRSAPQSKRAAELLTVASIEAPDALTLVVRTRMPFAPLPNRLAGVPISVEPGTAGGYPAGTGPYRISRWAKGKDTVLEAFDGYRGGTPAIRTIEFRVVPDAAQQLALLRRGEVHLVSDVSSARASALAEADDVRVVQRKGLLVTFLALDCARERSPYVSGSRNPFRDVRVRRALALAIDREALISGELAGQAEVVDQIVGPHAFGHRGDLPPWRHDPAEARRLLEEAGQAAGFAVDLDVLDSDVGRAAGRAIAADLASLGIRVQPRHRDLAALVGRIEARDTSAYLMPWIGTSGDAGTSYEYLLHTPGEGGLGIDNGGGYSNPQLDRLLDEASRRIRTPERRAMLMSAASLIRDDVPVIPLFRRIDVYAVARRLEFNPRLDREIHAAEMRWRR